MIKADRAVCLSVQISCAGIGCDGTVIGCGNDLSEILYRNVSGTVDARYCRFHVLVDDDVSAFIKDVQILKESGCRISTHVREDAGTVNC